MTKIAGRQVEIGIGIESTAGTAVAATDYFKWESFDMTAMSDKVLLKSARGIRNQTSNTIIGRKYGKGSVEFVPNVDIMPYALSLAMGSRSSGAHGAEAGVYDHTYTVQNANSSMKTATLLVKQGGLQTERYANCVADTLDLSFGKDFGKCKIGLLAGFPDTGSISSSYTQDTLFSRNNLSATFGSTLTIAAGTNATTTATTDTTNAADQSTITIGSRTYTFASALSNGGYTPYEILIAATAALTLANLKKAINATGTAGTDYGFGTHRHPDVEATTITSTTLLIVAFVSGTAANSIATSSTTSPNSHITWTGATINSGTPGTGPIATPLVDFSLNISNNVLFEDAFLSGANTPIAGGFIAGPLTIKGAYTLHFTDIVELAKYNQDTKSALIVTITGADIGTVSSAEQIIIKLGKLVLTKAPLQYQLDGLVVLKQEFEVQYDATDHECTIIVTNTNAGTNY